MLNKSPIGLKLLQAATFVTHENEAKDIFNTTEHRSKLIFIFTKRVFRLKEYIYVSNGALQNFSALGNMSLF